MSRRWAAAAMIGAWALGSVSLAAPNLVAQGELEHASERTTGRATADGNAAIFEFSGDRDFGRVIARGNNVGAQIAGDLVVGYNFFNSAAGRTYGLFVDASKVKVNGTYDIDIHFDLKGKIRPNRQYAYSVLQLPAESNSQMPLLKMIAPAIWADGQLLGAAVDLDFGDDGKDDDDEEDESPADPARRGIVRMPSFQYQTGGQSLILRLPSNFKGKMFLDRVSLREIDETLLSGKASRMPTPTRYVAIENPLERRVREMISASVPILKRAQNNNFNWGDVESTAFILDALASLGEDLSGREMRKAVDWLAEQEPTKVTERAARLLFLARYEMDKHRKTVAQDLIWLERAQFDDGGWAEVSHDTNEDRTINPTNLDTLAACLALREAHYAGLAPERKLWRDAARYWNEAQARDGGFRSTLDEYGGLGEATTISMTALGLAGQYFTLDMAFAAGSSRCDQYLANSQQVQGILNGLDWLNSFYGERYKMLSTIDDQTPAPVQAVGAMFALQQLVEVSGLTHFNGEDVFRDADEVLRFVDPNTGLFLGRPDGNAGFVLQVLAVGAAPPVIQRIIIGGEPEHELSRDAYHLVRYLRREHRKPFNWRAATIDQPIERLARTPILYVNVVGEDDWDADAWRKLRDYCFGGGVVLLNITEDNEQARDGVLARLAKVFPEYRLAEFPAGSLVLKARHKLDGVAGMKVISNGVKQLVFVTPNDWSCQLNLNDMENHLVAFQFIDNLFAYTLDEEDARPAYTAPIWDNGAANTMAMAVRHLEVGGEVPAWPDLVPTIDRTMRSGYRLAVNPASSSAAKPADLMWLSCTGPNSMSSADQQQVRDYIRQGGFLFADVVTGNANWAETFRSDLLKIDDRLRIRKMISNHTLMTGQVPETQGYDVRQVDLRQSLREEIQKLPRADLYVIELDGREVGALCTYDVASGVGYNHYSGCRGLMPEPSRRLATNVVLHALERSTAP